MLEGRVLPVVLGEEGLRGVRRRRLRGHRVREREGARMRTCHTTRVTGISRGIVTAKSGKPQSTPHKAGHHSLMSCEDTGRSGGEKRRGRGVSSRGAHFERQGAVLILVLLHRPSQGYRTPRQNLFVRKAAITEGEEMNPRRCITFSCLHKAGSSNKQPAPLPLTLPSQGPCLPARLGCYPPVERLLDTLREHWRSAPAAGCAGGERAVPAGVHVLRCPRARFGERACKCRGTRH